VNASHPPEGSVGVPLNTEIRVRYFGSLSNESFDPSCDLDLKPIRLQPDGGEPIELTGAVLPAPEMLQAWVVAKHVEPLAANTTYAVQVLLDELRGPCSCDGREWTTVSSFTSGEAEDHEPPTFTGLSSVEYGERFELGGSCGDSSDVTPVIPVFLRYLPVADLAPAPRYNIYVDGQISRRYVQQIGTDQLGELFVSCGAIQAYIAPGSSVEIRGVDLAGNESPPNTPIIMDVTCELPTLAPVAPDAGASEGTTGNTPSAPTDSSAPVITPASEDSSSGCDLSRRSAAASGAGAAMAAALLLLCGGRLAARRRASRAPS
jgi:hypothetical protein